ncbi:MAG: DNA methyltransferase, partial [Terriglobia bacterium]
MNQGLRNKLRNVVTQCRKLLEEAVSHELQGRFGIHTSLKKDEVTIEDEARMMNLTDEEQAYRKDLIDHYEHIQAFGSKPKDAFAQLIREIAFTHLNRLCAYKMMEARDVYVGGQKFREAVSRGVNSNGVKFYLADHPDDERLFNTGHQDVAYRHFLDWLGGLLSEEIGILFNPDNPANRLYPPQRVLDGVLAFINDEELATIWSQDETIGWVYQYFTPKELRDAARDPKQGGSPAPRNSYELAFRNQFFTPRYVVEFLTDNTLGRIWYEMRRGDTKLKDQCRYMVRRPDEIFLSEGQQPPKDSDENRDDLSQEELLKQPVYIPHRPKKDPRELKILDPACGSGHFLLYCFDLLLTIYEEAYGDSDLGPALQSDYPTLEDLKNAIPGLILKHNLHGIDIDLRCAQIAALALWLRCQRTYQEMGLRETRPKITRSNIVCAEPMPGEHAMLKEFVAQLEPKILGQLVEVVFDKMKLAGEAGSLLKIEEEIRDAVATAKRQWLAGPVAIQLSLFGENQPKVHQQIFDFSGISDNQFFEQAEAKVVDALKIYAEKTYNGQGLQKRLFAEDAVRGFAFVDICRKRFDTVLMNPPFGNTTPNSVSTLATQSASNLYSAFV